MKAINGLLVSLVAGSCVTAAMAGQDDVTKFIQPKVMNKVHMFGQIGGSGGFGTRAATVVDYYSNVDLGTNSFLFYGTGVTTTGDQLWFEKGGTNSLGNPVGPVASAAKVGEVEFWVVASDATSSAPAQLDCTVTMEMFDQVVDWSPVSTTALPNTCLPSGNDQVNQISLGGFYVDLAGSFAPYNGYVNGYILDTGSAGLAWTCNHGGGFLDSRTWAYNGGSAPVTLSTNVFPAYDGMANYCDGWNHDTNAPAMNYPALGYSQDNFYYDASGDGTYQRNERYFYGGGSFLANLMVRLAGDDGCSFDLDGDGFVGGNDIDYALELISAGCPY